MKTLDSQLRYIMGGGEVERFHSCRTLQRETVAEHQYGVAMLCWLLRDGVPPRDLLMAALTHDLAEQDVGDVPAPTKRRLGVDNALSKMEDDFLEAYGLSIPLLPENARTLKIADIFDGMLFCVRERQLGNTLVTPIFQRYNSYLEQLNLMPGRETELRALINGYYKEALNGCE